MKTKRKSREILGENTRKLAAIKEERMGGIKLSGKAVENAGGPAQRTWARILKDQNCEIDSVDKLADYFRVESWKLLVPDMNLTPSPLIRQGKPISPKQEQLIEQFEHANLRTKDLVLRVLGSRGKT